MIFTLDGKSLICRDFYYILIRRIYFPVGGFFHEQDRPDSHHSRRIVGRSRSGRIHADEQQLIE